MEEAKDAGMLEPGQHRSFPSQQLRDHLPASRLVQLVGHSLLEQKHGRLLQQSPWQQLSLKKQNNCVISIVSRARRGLPQVLVYR